MANTVWEWIKSKDYISVHFTHYINEDYIPELKIDMIGDFEIGLSDGVRCNRYYIKTERSIYDDSEYNDTKLIEILEEMYQGMLDIMEFDRRHRV